MFTKKKRQGFTLLELMIAAAIIVICLSGLLSTYVSCFDLSETSKNTNLALSAAQRVFEEMRSAAFTSIASAYNGYNFTVSGITTNESLGHVYVNNTNSSLLNVTVGVCWMQRNSKIIGECQVVSGVLTFIDSNGNNILDSPVELSTLIAQR